ncbi:Carbonic anhydrase-related protein 10 [Cyphomyrmex costatus]|uniref:Carbonic anhydrase-related protein 10 n=1 Tax=Cyphomyrmex costatus TaxID=456900 RepID=A0A195D5G3_9HYME|nr:Carbonic anhydrase-related protein 10 [Cyphomyrmex costatus]
MPGQSARTARNVIAGSPSGDEKRALISRTLFEELSRKLSKRCELAVAGSVSWLLRVDRLSIIFAHPPRLTTARRVKIYTGLFDPLCHPAQNDALISPMTPSDVPNRSVCVRVNEIFTAIYDQWVSVELRFRRELERHFMFRPSFWGLINPQWSLCTKGRRQSPINIEPDKLLFDRHLRPVHVDKHRVIYLIFQSTKLQSDSQVEFLQVSVDTQAFTNIKKCSFSVQFYRSVYYNVTFPPRYFYRGTEALYGHLFPLVFNMLPPFSTGHAPRAGPRCKRPELACDVGIIATSVSLNVDSFYRVSSHLSALIENLREMNFAEFFYFSLFFGFTLLIFSKENANLVVSSKDEIWSRLVPLFKRGLGSFHSRRRISGHLHNTGQFLVFRADREAKIRVNITGGPLAYHYQFEEIYIHYGMDDGHGSEHRINKYAFPAEIQVYGFNAELYHNMSEAQHKSQGLVAISLMVQLGETLNPELQIITSVFNKVIYRGDTAPVRYLSLKSLLPDTTGYMTYEGSTTHPGCWETAVWLILNKPIYITARELYALRKLMQGPSSTPKAPLGNNSRPLQGLHYRTVRTNIDFAKVILRCDYITRFRAKNVVSLRVIAC